MKSLENIMTKGIIIIIQVKETIAIVELKLIVL